ncbi:MAG: transcriptional regulator [Methyloceanibacter sp.]|nr:MAG: transcriptional regulator [Methyloceanibacter sp.]
MAKITAQMLPPVHPGEILKEEFLLPLGLSAGALARRIGVPRTRIERVVKEETPITTDTALRLAKVFGTSPEFWTNLQSLYDLKIAEKELVKELAGIEALHGGRHA